MTTKATNETPSASDICPRCGGEESLGGKILKPGECNVCVLVEDMEMAVGGVLGKHFPEAESGDVSPLVVLALSQAHESLATEWISNNVPGQAEPIGEPAGEDQPSKKVSDRAPPDGPWTPERWAAARADSRWAAERWAADMRDRFERYPTLHAEEKIRLAMRILYDVDDNCDNDTLEHYPEGMPDFEEYLARIGSDLYAITWNHEQAA